MKLSRVYSNDDNRFQPLTFSPGFNVLYARVLRPEEKEKYSHNLGKTLLIHLIDFLLLKDIRKGHFLHDHRSLFEAFKFYIELVANDGSYITVSRGVRNNTKISIARHESTRSMASNQESPWDHVNLPLDEAREVLNDLLDLSAISPYRYRKGVGYFLRTQADYQDVFQISKFSRGKDRDWKPFIALILGFNHELIRDKYDLDDLIEKKNAFKEEARISTDIDAREYDKVKGTLEIKRAEADEANAQINKFNFYRQDIEMNAELVERIEAGISDLNERLYTIEYEVNKIEESLRSRISFDIDKVEQLFEEVGVYLPDSLKASYEDLLQFNHRLSEERNRRLRERLVALRKDKEQSRDQLSELNTEREALLSVLQEKDTFSKFRVLQHELVRRETDIARLEAYLESLDKMAQIDREIQMYTQQRLQLVNLITDQINAGNETYATLRGDFNSVIRRVLGLPALISITVNSQGNLEPSADLIRSEESAVPTAEARGTSYKKLLCSAFDLSLLHTYAKRSFYRFVYHDGLLEGLDDKLKLNTLNVIRHYCDDYGLQHIMTVIDSDVPRDEEGKRVEFSDESIVRVFHEEGDDGRLFNMPKF